MTTPRITPDHWIWHTWCPTRFTPNADAYLILRDLLPPDDAGLMEEVIAAGLSAEQIIALCRYDELVSRETVDLIGGGIAYWVQQAHGEPV
jgi:hypothetical protein